MARILVLGASGNVGTVLCEAAGKRGHDVTGTCRRGPRPGLVPLDLRDAGGLRALLREARPDVVFCPAAIADVDACERDPAEARRVNVDGARLAAAETLAAGVPRFVAFSSEHVFDGAAGPYAEADPTNPMNEYGRTKLEMERALLALGGRVLVIRPTWVYGAAGKSFALEILARARRGEARSYFTDWTANPTYGPDLAEALLELAEAGASGIVHLAPDSAPVSRFDFARAVVSEFGLPPALVTPGSLADAKFPARRPPRAGLVPVRARALLKRARLRPPAEALADLRRILEAEGAARPSS